MKKKLKKEINKKDAIANSWKIDRKESTQDRKQYVKEYNKKWRAEYIKKHGHSYNRDWNRKWRTEHPEEQLELSRKYCNNKIIRQGGGRKEERAKGHCSRCGILVIVRPSPDQKLCEVCYEETRPKTNSGSASQE